MSAHKFPGRHTEERDRLKKTYGQTENKILYGIKS